MPLRTHVAAYDQIAREYEARVVPYYRPVAERLVALARPGPGMSVLDVGAGTGIVARTAEPRLRPGGMLALVDESAPMLEVAREHLAGPTPFLLIVSDARNLDLADGQFDLVLGQFSFLEELPAAIRHTYRVLKPGGRVALAIWGPDRLHDELSLLKAVRAEIGGPPPPPPSSPARVAYRLRRAGFARVASRQRYFPGVYADVPAYVHYRDGFPWRMVLPRRLWPGYMAAIARQAELRRDARGRVVIGRSVTFLTGRKPASAANSK